MKANQYIAKFVKVIDDMDKKGTKIPGLILSHAGFGKTSTIQKYCEAMDYNLITLIPSMFASDDILGIQSVKEGKLVRLTPSWFNKLKETIKNGKRTVLFIDEITTCDPYIQGPLLDLIFNGNLGEEKLPNNLFIVAAGNYSDDLNNVFKMSAPLVNRFVILNLNSEDFDIVELLRGEDFKELTDPEQIKDFLGLQEDSEKTFNFDNFKKWIIEDSEVSFGNTQYTEDEKVGLVGFTSIRSLDYSLRFAEAYMNTYNDPIWIRVVGDTLGTSEKREGKFMRDVLMTFSSKFYKKVSKKEVSLDEIIKKFEETGPTLPNMNLLSSFVKKVELSNITSQEMSKLTGLIAKYLKKNSAMTDISKLLNQKIQYMY